MFYPINYIKELIEYLPDLESTQAKNAEAEERLRELEAKVAEVEEVEKHWQGDRKKLLRQVEAKKT